jgi:hypothetical protein
MPVLQASVILPDDHVMSDEDRALINSSLALEERLAATEAGLAKLMADMDEIRKSLQALQAMFVDGKLSKTAMPALDATMIANAGDKVMMTWAERSLLGRLRPVDISTPNATSVGKSSMFVRYTGNVSATWTLDSGIYIVAIENDSANPTAVLSVQAPSGQMFDRSLKITAPGAQGALPGSNVVCCKRSDKSLMWRVS